MQIVYKIASYLKSSLLYQFFVDYILLFINLKTKFAIPHEYSYFGLKLFQFKDDIKIIDVGANIGNSSIYFIRIFKNSSIDAFEPNLKLKHELKKIRDKFKNFKFYNTALGEKKQSLFMIALTNPKKALDKICDIGNELNISVTKEEVIEYLSTIDDDATKMWLIKARGGL